MGDPIFLFFALLLGYIGVAIWIGLGVGRWLARHARRPVQILIQVLCVAVLLYLPVWDYIPGKILFERYCAETGGLQINNAAMPDSVFFEGEYRGSCRNCISALGTGAINVAEAFIAPAGKSHSPLILDEGLIRLTLASNRSHACEQLHDYFNRNPDYRDKSDADQFRMFWSGKLPMEFVERLGDTCVSWQSISHPSAELVLKPRAHGRPRFLWTYLYESRVELRRRADDLLVASYATYQYHPWLNAALLEEAPRMFIFRCPGPDRDGMWDRSFSGAKLFVEWKRREEDSTRED